MAQTIHNPVIAKGKSNAATLAGTVGVGVSSFTTTAPHTISVDDLVFVADSDGSDLEYVGQCVTEVSLSFTVDNTTALAHGSGAIVWTPTTKVFIEQGHAELEPLEDDAVTTYSNLNGGPINSQNADTMEGYRFGITNGRREDQEAWRVFKRAVEPGEFTLAFWNNYQDQSLAIKVIKGSGGDIGKLQRGMENYVPSWSFQVWIRSLTAAYVE